MHCRKVAIFLLTACHALTIVRGMPKWDSLRFHANVAARFRRVATRTRMTHSDLLDDLLRPLESLGNEQLKRRLSELTAASSPSGGDAQECADRTLATPEKSATPNKAA